MSGRLLMTQSLLNSWMRRFNPSTESYDPNAEFLRVLRKEQTETTPAMQDGIDFEELVVNIAKGVPTYSDDGKFLHYQNPKWEDWYDCAVDIANIVRGGSFQHKAYKDMTVSGVPLLLYGKLDVLKAGVIYDIKFSQSYERGKYRESPQHPMYFTLMPRAYEFTYLISDGADVFTETYRAYDDDHEPIGNTIYDFLNDIQRDGMMDIYREKWLADG